MGVVEVGSGVVWFGGRDLSVCEEGGGADAGVEVQSQPIVRFGGMFVVKM